jgi:hypothetical protein
MRDRIDRLRGLSPYDQTQERFLCRARQLIHDTFSPDALLELAEMKVSPMASGVALIRGIPVTDGLHELPQTRSQDTVLFLEVGHLPGQILPR